MDNENLFFLVCRYRIIVVRGHERDIAALYAVALFAVPIIRVAFHAKGERVEFSRARVRGALLPTQRKRGIYFDIVIRKINHIYSIA